MWSENSVKPWQRPQPSRYAVTLMAVAFALALVMCAFWELHLAHSVRAKSQPALGQVLFHDATGS